VKVAVCAMEKKTGSKPMQQILQRLRAFRQHGAGDGNTGYGHPPLI
jgi:hypothetical protein